MENRVIVTGAGIAGLSCALTLAENNIETLLVSNQASERSGSCMAEGGINAALDSYGDGDTTEKHFEDTKNNARGVVDEEGIRLMTEAAPETVRWLHSIGVQFSVRDNGRIDLRYFGGQKFRRTAFAGDSTGKQIMTALTDEARKYEASGLIKRLSHHSFQRLKICGDTVFGCVFKDDYTDETIDVCSPAVVMATGGYHGLFGNTTGAKADNGQAAATLFRQGVAMENLEFIQFHPTTITNGSKRMLVTEAARGEGGRLCTLKDGKPYYFMEEKYPELGNRMPRDVTSREIFRQNEQCYLDLTGVPKEVFEHKLNGLRNDCLLYLTLDPVKELIPVSPGIHYFMGGIAVDTEHRASYKRLYAAGECCASYHGANRLGGNSLLGAAFGGRKAAEALICDRVTDDTMPEGLKEEKSDVSPDSRKETDEIAAILNRSMGVVRDGKSLKDASEKLNAYSSTAGLFARASVACALHREESRGAHYRSDFTEMKKEFEGATRVVSDGKEYRIEIHHFR